MGTVWANGVDWRPEWMTTLVGHLLIYIVMLPLQCVKASLDQFGRKTLELFI